MTLKYFAVYVIEFCIISPVKDMNFHFLCRKMAILEAVSAATDANLFIFLWPVRQVTQPATTVQFILKVYQQNCNKYERHALNLKENSC